MQTTTIPYTYSNGTAYPTNTALSAFSVAPSLCLVRTRHDPSLSLFFNSAWLVPF